jgi:acyl homoserine lactone synthase
MRHTLLTHTPREMSDSDRTGMFRLRCQTFRDRLGWDVKVTEDGLEIDEYDRLDRVRYIIARAPDTKIDACWRLLPTLGPNMLRDIFPQLMHGQPVPAAADTWELSRFAVASDRMASQEGEDNHQIGFGELSVAMMRESTHFACEQGISRYVTVTTTAIERLLKRQGLNIHRVGPPIRIGMVMTVACFIEIDEITLAALTQ